MAERIKFDILRARLEINHLRRNEDQFTRFKIAALKCLISEKRSELAQV